MAATELAGIDADGKANGHYQRGKTAQAAAELDAAADTEPRSRARRAHRAGTIPRHQHIERGTATPRADIVRAIDAAALGMEVSADDVAWLYGELAERGKANGKLCRTAGITCGHGNDCAGLDEHAGLKPKSLGHVHAALRSILGAAVEDGLIVTNPCDTKRARQARPRGGKATGKGTERQCWTDAQARGFIGGGDPLHPLWQVVLGAGLRRGEAVGLRWEHVDLERGLLNVRRSVTVVRGQPVVDEYGGKTDAAYRTIVLGDELADVLREHGRRQAEERLRLGPVWLDSDAVFPAVDGQPLNPGQASRAFTRATAAAGLPAIGLHGLRHTHATMLLRAGVPITAVGQRLGHEDPSITLSTYAHAIPADDALAADATGRVLFGAVSA